MRTILHADINSCYASIEAAVHPEYRNVPLAVAGEQELRHGIILAKNELAKKAGIQTGEAIWQAKKKCPKLVVVPPDYMLYHDYCSRMRKIYAEYTDRVEAFGADECWLDVTGSNHLFGSGEQIAEELRRRAKTELGVTVSVGVSWNKVFAKFGSDYKKPDAITVITPENFREIVWPAPVCDLLYVGPASTKRLVSGGIYTIGDIANSTLTHMRNALGRMGEWIYCYACGMDNAPVHFWYERDPIKSIGNSATPPRDIRDEKDARLLLYMLSDSVAKRLRANGFVCGGMQLHLRDTSLISFERQMQFERDVCTAYELCTAAQKVLAQNWSFSRPLRSIGVRAINLHPATNERQLSLFAEEQRLQKKEILESTADDVRSRFGPGSLFRALTL